MNRGELLTQLKNITDLPTLPVIVMEVNRLLQDYESPLEKLVDLLEKDQTLVVKILRLVNSSFYGFKGKVNSLRHAVTLMGYNTVRNAVVSMTVMDTLDLKKDLEGFDISTFWKHSISVAVISKYLAAKSHLAPSEDAFTSGLLHDVGKVVLANYFPGDLMNILRTADQDRISFLEAELKLNSYSHSLIGSYMAQRWLLPEVLINTIKCHHLQSGRVPFSNLVALVDVADNLAHIIAGDTAHSLHLGKFPEETQLKISAAMNDGKWFLEVKKDITAACGFFNKG